MNLFDVIFLDIILIIFPILFYLVYLSTNKIVCNNTKELIYNFAIASSFFLMIKFGDSDYKLFNFLMMSSIILVSYLKNKYILTFILIVLLYVFFDVCVLLFIPYIILMLILLLKKYIKICDIYVISIFIFLETIIILLNDFNISNLFMIAISYFVIHFIYILINRGEELFNYHIDYKELQREKLIRLSLFKVTHEIKNPIAVCKGYLDMLDVNNCEQVSKYIPIVKSEVDRLLTLLEDFMLINKNNVEMDIMDINMLLEEVIAKLNMMMVKKNIVFKSDLIDDEIYINGDYKRLGQVFINLIKNSIEAIPDSRRGFISISNSVKNNVLCIVICDNGVGISDKIMKRIKEPFYTTKLKGTGLGVSLSNEIINAHNGSLEYYSSEGVLTKTVVQIPLYNEA